MLLAGLPGAGKSTLLNRLYGLSGEETAPVPAGDVRIIDSRQSRNWWARFLRPLPVRLRTPLVHVTHVWRIGRAVLAGHARYFGVPDNAFVVCTSWYVNALAQLGRRDEARDLYARLLACRTSHGLLAEHVDPATREPWGNFVQTYSMVGLISAAKRLSMPWDEAF